MSVSGVTGHSVLSFVATQVGVVSGGSDDDNVDGIDGVEEGKDDVGDEASVDDCVVVEDLGMIFTATPGLTLKSLPSSALHVFIVELPHQKFMGLSAPSPLLHG